MKKARQAAELERLRNAALAAKGSRAEKQKERKASVAENDADQQKKAMEEHLAKAEKLRKKLQKSEEKAAKLAAQSTAVKTVVENQKLELRDPDDAETMLRAATIPGTADALPSPAPNTVLGLAYGSDSEEDPGQGANEVKILEEEAESFNTSSSSSIVSSSDSESDLDDASGDSSDSDDAPEAASSRMATSVLPSSATEPPHASTKIPHPCRYAKMRGGCRNGANCRYLHPGEKPPPKEKHEKQDKKKKKGPQVKETPRRKTVYDRMVEQEEQEEHMRALQAIKYLGSVGFFE